MNKHLDAVDQEVADKHLLKHPFYLAWTAGKLPKEALSDYTRQYYHHVAAFPTYLSAVHSRCDDQGTRKQLLANLMDEEAGSPNHPELWLSFARALGLAESDVRGTPRQTETQNLIDAFRAVCRDEDVANGLAALYAYESQIPSICESKIEGLRKYYGVTDPESFRYFSVHIEADREHSAAERTMLARQINEHNFAKVQQSVRQVLDALWELLSGVCRRHAIAC
jgi:pyrroloquinoline-quinone synthase